VLDDWSRGYIIYKLDVDSGGDPDDADLDLRAERLPEQPVFRLEIPTNVRGRFALFAAVSTRIFAMDYSDKNRDAPVLVYDTASPGPGGGREGRPPRAPKSQGPHPR
jgi:hypothetical protein